MINMKYHFIGIKGTGMASLAQIMFDLGFDVQGSDKENHFFTEDDLIKKGIKVLVFDEDNITQDLIIVQGNAFDDSNCEVKKAKELNLKIYSYQEMIGKITDEFKTITVSGCHGKTTTSALMSHVINNICGCNYLIVDGTGHATKENEFFVLEACEWKRHFLAYTPYYAIITNIELDHVDYFKDIDDVINAYEEYSNKAKKVVIACGDDLYTRKLKCNKQIVYYGINEDNDVIAKNVKLTEKGTEFDVYIKGELYGNFNLPLFGKHMLLNSLAVITVCFYENIASEDINKYLKTFKGAKRRFKENIINDIVTIDDYAHHPTEVSVTINAARQKYPNKKIVAIFKAHTLSRVKEFSKEFADALNLADKSYITEIGVDRVEIGYEGVTHDLILSKLNNGDLITLDDAKELMKYKDAVIIFMSSKDIYLLQEKYEKLLKENNKIVKLF